MAGKFNEKEVNEINAVIADITKALKKDAEICARNPVTLKSLLTANKVDKKVRAFACKPQYSALIVDHFKKEKGLTVSKFNMNLQNAVCLIY
jgi:hypothetical protein